MDVRYVFCIVIWRLRGESFKIYRVHGFTGDYVERDNVIASKRIFSIDDLRKGRLTYMIKLLVKELRKV